MRTLASFALVALLAFPLSGCGALGMFGGAPDLTAIEVAGRYEFTTFTLDPVSDAVRDYRALGEEVYPLIHSSAPRSGLLPDERFWL